MFVGGVVVGDQMDLELRRNVVVEMIKKREKMAVGRPKTELAMHKDLSAISTAISKSEPTTGSEMKKSAEKLHDQLQSANRTVGELSDHAGIRAVPVKRRAGQSQR
jgi:hypothetical protein